MVAIYARQSLDKKDSISIETQIDFCKREIADNAEYRVFQDKGFSGKNIDRPAFVRLMKAIANNAVSKIIVYRLDRISRSITDFASIIEILEKNKVDFVSANEKFDTSTPVGRAMLYIIMIFAQLERETIAERIKDNYYSRGKTGVWLGGPAPFGFTHNKEKKAALLLHTENIEIVKEIYYLYANTDSSLGGISKSLLNRHGSVWNNVKLSRILHNPAYVMADADIYNYFNAQRCIIVNDIEHFTGDKGCSLYGKRDRNANKYRSLDGQVLALACHDGVIDSRTWLLCQYKLKTNKQIKNAGKGKHTWLTGLLKCGYCGYSMNVKQYKNRKYLSCTGRYSANLCTEKLRAHDVGDIEFYVANEIKSFAAELRGRKVNSADNTNQLKIALHNVERQIDKLIDSLASSNTVLTEYVNKKITELDGQKTDIMTALNKQAVKVEPVELPADWSTLSMEVKRGIAYKLIERVNIFNGKIEVVWRY